MIFMKRLCSLVNLKVSWGIRRLKVCINETIIIMGGLIVTIRIKTIMKAW